MMIDYVDGFITLSKVEKKMDVLDVFAGLGEALRERGYDSEEKITGTGHYFNTVYFRLFRQ